MQCVVVDKETAKETFELENTLTQESSVTINGVVRSEPRSVGGYELGVQRLKFIKLLMSIQYLIKNMVMIF